MVCERLCLVQGPVVPEPRLCEAPCGDWRLWFVYVCVCGAGNPWCLGPTSVKHPVVTEGCGL